MRIEPGCMIGFMGGGQLARMMALEARRMGYRIAVLDPDADGPGAQVADCHVEGRLDDAAAAARLARQCAVVTVDTEHVPADVLEHLETFTLVRPSSRVLRRIQDRLSQRHFLKEHDLPQTAFAPVQDAGSLRAGSRRVGFPAVLKTRRSGYDGKGQVSVSGPRELTHGWEALAKAPAVIEARVDFAMEISVLLARGTDGRIEFHPTAENEHHRHVLHTSRVPAGIPAELDVRARELGARIAAALGHVGMMAVELFVTRDGGLLVNEIAPRTHNSGHYSFGACATSQFEQHIRAICGLPLGNPALLRPAVMLNLLGDFWRGGAPDFGGVMALPEARLHLYGKSRAEPGRKMGHVLVMDNDIHRAAALAAGIDSALARPGAGGPRRESLAG